MKSSLFLATVLLALVCCSSTTEGYLLNSSYYYGAGDLYPSYQTYNGPTNNNVGKYFFKFSPSSNAWEYHIISTLPIVGAVTMNGPSNCAGYGQNDVRCVNNDAPVIMQLAYGANPTLTGDASPGNQYFSGTITLSTIQVTMLFWGELYLEINTAVQDPNNANNYINVPVLRGHLYPFSQPTNNPTMYAFLDFQQNSGQFGDIDHSSSTNKGVGWIAVNPSATSNQMSVTIYTSIKEAGRYYLQCDTGSVQIYPTNTNQGATPGLNGFTVSFTAAQAPILSEVMIPNQCFVFITSSDFPNGDLFSFMSPIAEYTAISQGKNENTPVTSANYAISYISFDYGSKTFTIATSTNLTASTVTGVQVLSSVDQRIICSYTYNPPTTTWDYLNSGCYMNGTDIPLLVNGQISINFQTSTHSSGELRGAIIPAGYTSGPSSLALGLGVGLGVGIPVAAGAGVGLFFLVKHFSGSMSSNGKI